MAEYHLLTTWRIKAPLTDVYDAIHDSLRWPDWWPGSEKVEQTAAGGKDGIDNIRRYSWKGELPYPVVFEVRATRIEALVAIEGRARGDLEGTGRWRFAQHGEVSIVDYEWHVRSARWWMNLLAPLARPIFIRNHTRIMTQGGEGLARRLDTTLLDQKNIDLMAENGVSSPIPGHFREGGRINPQVVPMVGIAAGILATIAQIALWRLAGMPILETLFRDAHLTAALLMGPDVLPPPATGHWDILLVATLIHFALSISYALVPALLAARLAAGPAIVAGALYGLGIYFVNLYGLTLLFPWFAVARDWVTLLTHIVFGMALTGGCWWFAQGDRKAKALAPREVPTT
jgi:uncharacterized protein YndB with AHSA1/START domain